MNGISVYFIHNTRGLPGGSPHSLVFTGFSEEGRSFFLPVFGRLTTIALRELMDREVKIEQVQIGLITAEG